MSHFQLSLRIGYRQRFTPPQLRYRAARYFTSGFYFISASCAEIITHVPAHAYFLLPPPLQLEQCAGLIRHGRARYDGFTFQGATII